MGRKPSNTKKKIKYQDNLDDDFDFGQKDSKKSASTLQGVDIKIEYKNANQKLLGDLIKTKDIVICAGAAGCGKTYVMCAEALKLIKEDPRYKKIYLIKSVTTLEDESIGYLRGGLSEKMDPFMFSFIHNFRKLIGEYDTDQLVEKKIIEIMPIAYLRGINLDQCIILVDETQNISLENCRSLLTRIGSCEDGSSSKMIVSGDTNQVDMKNKSNSSLEIIIEKFKDKEGFGTMQFSKDDIVRNPIIKIVEDVFEEIKKEMK